MKVTEPKKPCRLNLDLILDSTSDLQPLVEAMGTSVRVLFLGRRQRFHKACLEVSGMPRSLESSILKFCRLIHKLPRPARDLWDGARLRMFLIGVDSASKGTDWFELSGKAVAEVAKLNATIAVSASDRPGMTKRRG